MHSLTKRDTAVIRHFNRNKYNSKNSMDAFPSVERTLINSHGLEFEDCYRRAVMLGEMPDERDLNLLFDFRDTRYPSMRLKFIYRDNVLGLRRSPFAVGGW